MLGEGLDSNLKREEYVYKFSEMSNYGWKLADGTVILNSVYIHKYTILLKKTTSYCISRLFGGDWQFGNVLSVRQLASNLNCTNIHPL